MATNKITNLYPKDDKDTIIRPNILSECIIDKDTDDYVSGHVPDSALVKKSVTQVQDDISTIEKDLLNTNSRVNDLENDSVDLSSNQTITGKKEFTNADGIGVDSIHNTNGNALVRYKSTEGKNVFGGSNHGCTLMGNEDRPKYSKDGSDFAGSELSLMSDLEDFGIGRWENKDFFMFAWDASITVKDKISPYYTSINAYMTNSTIKSIIDNTILSDKSVYLPDFNTNKMITAVLAFSNIEGCSELHMGNCYISGRYVFSHSNYKKILTDDKVVKIGDYALYTFGKCKNLEEIGAFDMSEVVGTYISGGHNIFEECSKLKSIHCKHWKVSFVTSYSKAFEESDLVEIISNLDEVTTTQTLTMGATNLAKLTDEEKAVATNKGWTLA